MGEPPKNKFSPEIDQTNLSAEKVLLAADYFARLYEVEVQQALILAEQYANQKDKETDLNILRGLQDKFAKTPEPNSQDPETIAVYHRGRDLAAQAEDTTDDGKNLRIDNLFQAYEQIKTVTEKHINQSPTPKTPETIRKGGKTTITVDIKY